MMCEVKAFFFFFFTSSEEKQFPANNILISPHVIHYFSINPKP